MPRLARCLSACAIFFAAVSCSATPPAQQQTAQPVAGCASPEASPGSGTALSNSQDTDLCVKLLTPISTETSRKGDKITAQVIGPQGFNGDILEGTVRNSTSGGKVHGKSVLNFTFETLHHQKQAIPVQATVKQLFNSQGKQDVDEEGQIVQKKSNVGKLAAATAVGALIGGLAGGGKGAAIGAGVGAVGALVLVEVATKGNNISFAAGSEFNLAVRSNAGRQQQQGN